MDKEKLLKIRETIRKKKPEFIRQDAHKMKRLEKKWRKPKGLHSKMRHKFRGYRRCVDAGWRGPKEVRGLHRSGQELVNVANLASLQELDPKKHAIIISKIGRRKKLEIVKEALDKGFTFANLVDPKGYLEDAKKDIKASKAKKLDKEKKEKAKIEKEKKKSAKSDSIEDMVKKDSYEKKPDTEKEIKDKQKKEQDKLLTKKR